MSFWDDYGSLIIGFLVVVVLLAGLVFGVGQLSKAECMAKTEHIGFNRQWSYLGGCQIEVNPGQWIPLDSYYFKQE